MIASNRHRILWIWYLLLCTCTFQCDAQPEFRTGRSDDIIGGHGIWRYKYEQSRLPIPEEASIVNCHGFVLDEHENIYLTYENNGVSDRNCLIKWSSDAKDVGEFVISYGADLCSGTPHGLTIAKDSIDEEPCLYHANNEKKLTKTFLNGTVVWQTVGSPKMLSNDGLAYRPTWLAVAPDEPYIYLCDGYGSNNVYLVDRMTGIFFNQIWGGPGNSHGKFASNHGCVYDSFYDQIVVADRENGRLEYFDYQGGLFEYSHTTNLRTNTSKLGNASRPCILRRQQQKQQQQQQTHRRSQAKKFQRSTEQIPSIQSRVAAVPDLRGSVAILNEFNEILSVVNVSSLIGHLGHLHPHDAQLLSNGDLIVATWNPGRVSYWQLLSNEQTKTSDTIT